MQENSSDTFSRNEIITWINDLLKLNVTKIEQLSTGAVYCQLLDILYPGKVPLYKVNWKAKLEYEFVYNLKILQQSFIKLNINRPIDIERVVKSKYQDNFEFICWMKKFFDSNTPSLKDYNPILRRNNSEINFNFLEKNNTKPAPRNSSRDLLSNRPMSLNKNNSNMSFLSNKENELLEKIKDEKYLHYDVLKAEREFFFGKLRDIDHLLDNFDRNKTMEEMVGAIRSVLYMTPNKIVVIGEDGSLKFEETNENILNLKELNFNNTNGGKHNDDISMQIE